MKKVIFLLVMVVLLWSLELPVKAGDCVQEQVKVMMLFDTNSSSLFLVSRSDYYAGSRDAKFINPNQLLAEGWKLFQVVPGPGLKEQTWVFIKCK